MTTGPVFRASLRAQWLRALALALALGAAQMSFAPEAAANDLESLRRRAQQGEADAQYILADKLHRGDGVARDDVAARALVLQAAKRGHLDAQRSLGFYYWRSYGGPQDKVEALKWILIAERGGNKDAANVRANMLKSMSPEQVTEARARADAEPPTHVAKAARAGPPGVATPPAPSVDVAKARAAAEQGDPAAQVLLAQLYFRGEGVDRDDKAAFQWARKAAEQGDKDGQRLLAAHYLTGRGVPQDPAQAEEWLRKSAAQGDELAAGTLKLLPTLNAVAKYAEAQAASVEVVRKAAGAGNAQAQYQLSRFYAEGAGVPRDKKLEVEWERKAAEQGHVDALGSLGIRLVLTHDGVKGDFWKGYGFLYRAGALGHLQSQRILGTLFQQGSGVKKDVVTSLIWLDVAVMAGDARAKELREDVLKEATPQQVAEANRRAVAWMKRPPVERATPEGAP